MSVKRKASSAKTNWLAVRRKYTWHLRPPFKTHFDRAHWWKGKPESDIESAAALYELARRRSLVRKTWIKKLHGPNPQPIESQKQKVDKQNHAATLPFRGIMGIDFPRLDVFVRLEILVKTNFD